MVSVPVCKHCKTILFLQFAKHYMINVKDDFRYTCMFRLKRMNQTNYLLLLSEPQVFLKITVCLIRSPRSLRCPFANGVCAMSVICLI